MRNRLEHLSERLKDLDEYLSRQDAAADIQIFRQATRERSSILPATERYAEYQKIESEWLAAQTWLKDPELVDDEIKSMVAEEIGACDKKLTELETELSTLMLPRDPDDDKNILLEIRAGTGGDEAALFVGDLLRMYSRYAEQMGWQCEMMSANESELGGFREVIIRIAGENIYQRLKFESGAHRVQRIPVTESQGRIHTSACTVAILAEADELLDIQINSDDLRIDTFRASGAGGQHVNKTESAIRITHLPTGLVVECQDERSQHRNKDKAMKVLAARLKDRQTQEAQAKQASQRKSLVGSGDRSERIRTYNFPQGRLTDHRINLTLYKLESIINGDLNDVLDGLAAAHQAELLASIADND